MFPVRFSLAVSSRPGQKATSLSSAASWGFSPLFSLMERAIEQEIPLSREIYLGCEGEKGGDLCQG